MSNEALTWAFKHEMTPIQKLVLIALADYADENGECYPRHETTAQRTCLSLSTVKRSIKGLAEGGYLTKVHQYRDDGRYRSNRYRLNLAKVPTTTPEQVPGQSDPVIRSERTDQGVTVTPIPGHSDTSTGSERAIKNPQLTPIGTPKETSSADAADEQSPAEDTEPREDVEQVCKLLADCIEANGSKRPTVTERWRDAARLLIDRDGKSPQQISWIIQWCQQDEFWRTNVLSMPTLRRQFDRLRLKAQQDSQPRVSKRERENLAFLQQGTAPALTSRERENQAFLNGGQPFGQSFLGSGQSWEGPCDVPGQRALPMFGEVES